MFPSVKGGYHRGHYSMKHNDDDKKHNSDMDDDNDTCYCLSLSIERPTKLLLYFEDHGALVMVLREPKIRRFLVVLQQEMLVMIEIL